jgi:hypothetical protein
MSLAPVAPFYFLISLARRSLGEGGYFLLSLCVSSEKLRAFGVIR